MSFLIDSEPTQALEFLDHLYSGLPDTALVSIVRIHPTGGGRDVHVLPLGVVRQAIHSSGLDPLIWKNSDFYDLYIGVSTLKTKPDKAWSRGRMSDMDKTVGVWLDIDTKDGAFDSQAQAIEFLNQWEAPSAVVLTGHSGVHAYWKFDKPVSADLAGELCLRWWHLMDERAEGRKIDRLCDATRVMRLPGAIRWPKKSDQPVALVSMWYKTDATYTPDQIIQLTDEVWEKYQARLKATRDSVSRSRVEVSDFLERLSDTVSPAGRNKYYEAYLLSNIEDVFAEKYSWASLLEPLGWTMLREDDDGRIHWSRPGDGIRKSATTDWEESPHVMSLFSTAEETGLSHLLEAEIVLTKYRVWVQLYWHGDEEGAVRALMGELYGIDTSAAVV